MTVKGNIPDIKKRAVLEIGRALEREIENRKNADEEEAAARKEADNTEKSAREAKDTELENKLNKEISDRKSADSTEKEARESADDELETKLEQEIADRKEADKEIKGAIEGYEHVPEGGSEGQILARSADGLKWTDAPAPYTHPKSGAGAKTAGLYKIATDDTGHVTEAAEVTKDDITALGIIGGGDVPDNIVTADKTFNADEIIVAAENGRGVKSSGVKLSELNTGGEAPVNVVTANSALASGKLIAGAGERGIEATNIDASQVVTADAAFTAEHVLTATGEGKKAKDSGVEFSKLVTSAETHAANEIPAFKSADTNELTGSKINADDLIDAINIAKDPKMHSLSFPIKNDIFPIALINEYFHDAASGICERIAIKTDTFINHISNFQTSAPYLNFSKRLKELSSYIPTYDKPALASAIYNVNETDYYIIAASPGAVLYWDTEKSTMDITNSREWYQDHPEKFLKCVPLLVTDASKRSDIGKNLNMSTENIPATFDDDSATARNSVLVGGTFFDYATVNDPATGWESGTWKEFE